MGQKEDTVILEDGTRIHWLGDRFAKTILLYCHGAGPQLHGRLFLTNTVNLAGGSYAIWATKMHFEILCDLVNEATLQQGSSLAVLFLSYGEPLQDRQRYQG